MLALEMKLKERDVTSDYKSLLGICYMLLVLRSIGGFIFSGKKRKDQHDANQTAAGMNPAYAGAYGTMPPVSILSFPWHPSKHSLQYLVFVVLVSLLGHLYAS